MNIGMVQLKRFIGLMTLVAFLCSSVMPAYAQSVLLPAPGTMVALSQSFNPPVLKGIKVYSDNPLKFDFILDKGGAKQSGMELKDESNKLIKYFLASLTVPEQDLWVNLSPYEKDRIIPDAFGQTQMGRDLLAQDYFLKQITSSLMFPEGELGKRFWAGIYKQAQETYGTTDIPVDTFNKVWIVPQKAVVFERSLNSKEKPLGDAQATAAAYVVETHLKVMLETDYVAMGNSVAGAASSSTMANQSNPALSQDLTKNIIKEIILPALEKEVNEGGNFAQLRQVYNSLILATWYKRKVKGSILSQVYADKNKIVGVNITDPKEAEKIWAQYLEAFKKGVYNFVKEEKDEFSGELIPRKYFSGGETFVGLYDKAMTITTDSAAIVNKPFDMSMIEVNMTSSVPLDQYIPYRKVFRAQGQGADVKEHMSDPEAFQRTVEEGAKDLEPAKINSLITRQAPIEQAILELVSNEADAVTGRSAPIGRFGVGAFQQLAFVLDQENYFQDGNHIIVDTKTQDGLARRILFFKASRQGSF